MPTAEELSVTRSHLLPQHAARLPLQWLELYGDALYAYAIRRVRRPEVAEDLLQETLLSAMQAHDSFADRSTVKTWLTGILRNKIADHLRRRYRNSAAQIDIAAEDELFTKAGKWKSPVARWAGDPHQLAELKELRAVLNGCMSKLPTRMAHLFLSRATEELTTTELCQQLSITPENAWMLLHRARSQLAQCMTRNWFRPPNNPGKTSNSSKI